MRFTNILPLIIQRMEKNKAAVDIAEYQKPLYDKWKSEIEIIKVRKIGNVSFYEYSMKSIHRLTITLRNRNITVTLKAADYRDAFVLYSSMISSRLEKAKKRNDLIDPSLVSLNYLSGSVLADYPSMDIFSYLSNKDLENLIKASALAKQDAAPNFKKEEIPNADNASQKSRKSIQ